MQSLSWSNWLFLFLLWPLAAYRPAQRALVVDGSSNSSDSSEVGESESVFVDNCSCFKALLGLGLSVEGCATVRSRDTIVWTSQVTIPMKSADV